VYPPCHLLSFNGEVDLHRGTGHIKQSAGAYQRIVTSAEIHKARTAGRP
jgi:hypothetical protein